MFSKLRDRHVPRAQAGSAVLLAVLSILIVVIALILSLLCLLAGESTGMMQDYAVFTLNVSRIGENLKQDLDKDIGSLTRRSTFEPFLPTRSGMAVVTPAPSTLIKLRERDLFGKITKDITAGVHHVTKEVSGGIHHATHEVEVELVDKVNEAYKTIVGSLHLEDFYNLHMMTSCSGTYITESGKNITVGEDTLPGLGTQEHVDACEAHSALDPLQIFRWAYILGIAFTGAELGCAAFGLVEAKSWKLVPILNVLVASTAFTITGLVSAVLTGVAVGAAKLINFVGEDIGVAGYAGHKFLALTWTATGLLGLNAVVWCGAIFVRYREAHTQESEPSKPLWGHKGQMVQQQEPAALSPVQYGYGGGRR